MAPILRLRDEIVVIKAVEYFLVVLLVMLHTLVLTFDSVGEQFPMMFKP